MAAREANVKLTLNGGSFVATMNEIERKNESAARKSEEAWRKSFRESSMFSGLKGGASGLKRSFGDMTSTIRQGVGAVATLGGAVGVGAMVKQTLELRSKFRDIEFQLNKNGNASTDWRTELEQARGAAERTGQSTATMGGLVQKVFADTGDLEFTRAAIEAIGHANTAAGESTDQLAVAAGVLKEKFGATVSTLGPMMAVFLEKTQSGALSLDDLNARFGLLAGEAQEAGMGGAEGLSTLLGLLDQLDNRIGEKSVPSMKKLFQTLKSGSHDLRALEKKTGLKFDADATAVEKIRKIVASPKAAKVMVENLGGEMRVVFDELAKPFDEAAARAKAEGKDAKAQRAAGLAAFDASITTASKSTLDWAKVLKTSADRSATDPEKKLQRAIEKIEQAFERPEMLEAIDRITDRLPAFANAATSAIDFITRRPKTAIAAAVGGKLALGVLGGVGERLGEGLSKRLESGAEKMGASFMAKVAADGGWGKVAGQFGMVAAGAMLAFQFGKSMIDASMSEDEKKTADLQDAASTAEAMAKHGTGTAEERAAAAQALREKISAAEKEGKPGIANRLFGGLAFETGLTDEHPVNAFNAQVNAAKEALAELERAPAGATRANERLAQAASSAASALEKITGAAEGGAPPPGSPSGTSKGPGGPANGRNVPGHMM